MKNFRTAAINACAAFLIWSALVYLIFAGMLWDSNVVNWPEFQRLLFSIIGPVVGLIFGLSVFSETSTDNQAEL